MDMHSHTSKSALDTVYFFLTLYERGEVDREERDREKESIFHSRTPRKENASYLPFSLEYPKECLAKKACRTH